MAITLADADNLYASGNGKGDDDRGVWSFVRRSADGGQTWELETYPRRIPLPQIEAERERKMHWEPLQRAFQKTDFLS